MSTPPDPRAGELSLIERVVKIFLHSKLSLVLILLAVLLGTASLLITPREKDPQIIVPMVDIYVSYPGHSAKSVEQLVTTPLEKLLYQIHGVEYVYSTSRRDQSMVTARFFVGQDVERSVVKVFRKIKQHLNRVPAGVTGWVIKPETINDVPIVTLTLTSKTATAVALRQTAEELAARLAAAPDVSRAYVIGGRPRVVYAYLSPSKMHAYNITPLEIDHEIQAADVTMTAGSYQRNNNEIHVLAGTALANARQLGRLVVSVWHQQPVYLSNVAKIVDGPAEVHSYVWHTWGPAANVPEDHDFPGTLLAGKSARRMHSASPAVTVAIAKKAGSNAVTVAADVIHRARVLAGVMLPSTINMIVTRNSGLSANAKVNGLVDGLLVAIVIVIVLLTIGLGWRESIVVAVAIPVVFGLTLACNLMLGFTINRVTLFALILSLGLLVDDPIVDVENISRHFALEGKATRLIALKAISEVLGPLIVATLAVILSFIPMFFITGMMGPYMRPMAFNVPVAMLMSMLVAFTITPWMAYHMLKNKHRETELLAREESADPHVVPAIQRTIRYRVFSNLLGSMLEYRLARWGFLLAVAGVTVAAVALPAMRMVPLKMLPFSDQSNLLIVIHAPRGTTVQGTDAATRALVHRLERLHEVVDITSYVGVAAPMDFNGLVRHYFIRNQVNDAQIAIDLAGKQQRAMQTHEIALRIRNSLTAIAHKYGVRIQIVEAPPGPPVLDTIVGEIHGSPTTSYHQMQLAAHTLRHRLLLEPDVVDVDDSVQAPQRQMVFVTDKRKAALSGVTTSEISRTLALALGGTVAGTIHAPRQRQPLNIILRLPIARRSSRAELSGIFVRGTGGVLVPLAELGHWKRTFRGQAIYHKDLRRIVYVYADTAGRPPVNAILDVEADRVPDGRTPKIAAMTCVGNGWIHEVKPRPLSDRSFFHDGSGIAWQLPPGIHVNFAGEGEWRVTIHVFRDLGLAFGAAMIGIYVLLIAQTGSFLLPLIIMLAIPLTIPGVMPGFWILNVLTAHQVGGYRASVFFTATAMIGMIALAGIVTRNAIILIDFIHRSLANGQSLYDAILESVVVRMRPILLTAAAAMLSSIPILSDPIFSGLAWALIFGLLASTIFTLFVIPVTYYILFINKPGHGAPTQGES
ncbi:MAG: efflux RND transporter permease subunit [Phycisphaerae bacterium]